ncbi:MAG TPA: energy transducer TonB [Polyangiaceae bacterium]|nr:energy transducer TonB [Polyangiaceae bacterium]
MFARLLSQGRGESGVALGASVLAHLAVGAALLVGPVRERLRLHGRDVTFFAPSRPQQAAAATTSGAARAGGGELSFPSGPNALAQAEAGDGRASKGSNETVNAALTPGQLGALRRTGDDASLVVYPFGEGMARPQLLSGRDPKYTPEALKRGVEGTVIARCVIDREGQVRACRIIRGVDSMNDEVIQALESRRYTPVVYDGRPVDVDYVFRVHLVLKNDAPPSVSAPPKRQEGRGESHFARASDQACRVGPGCSGGRRPG